MSTEDIILEYLDGSLDPESSAELLHRLSVSPEKRAILEEHLKAKEIISLGQKPFAIPPATEAALRGRLSILRGEDSLKPIGASFFSSRSAIVGASLAGIVLLVLGIFLFRPAADQNSQHTSGSKLNSITNEHKIEQLNDITNGASKVSPPNSLANISNVSRSLHLHLSVPSHTSFRYRVKGAPNSVAALNDNSEGSASNNANSNISNTKSIPSGQLPDKYSLNRNTASDNKDEEIPGPIETVDKIVPVKINVGPAIFHSLSVNLLGSQVWKPAFSVRLGMDGVQTLLPAATTITARQTALSAFPSLALQYEISPWWSIGLRGGQRVLPISGNGLDSVSTNQGITKLNYHPTIGQSSYYYSMLTISTVFNPEDAYRLEAEAGGGAAFSISWSPLVEAGLNIEHELTNRLAISSGIFATGTWSNLVDNSAVSASTSSSGAIGITHLSSSGTRLFTSALGIRANLILRLW